MCEIPVPGCCVCCRLCQDAAMGLLLVLSAPVPPPLLAFPTEHPKIPGLCLHPKLMWFLGVPFPMCVSHRVCPGCATSLPAPSRAVGVQGSCGCPVSPRGAAGGTHPKVPRKAAPGCASIAPALPGGARSKSPPGTESGTAPWPPPSAADPKPLSDLIPLRNLPFA